MRVEFLSQDISLYLFEKVWEYMLDARSIYVIDLNKDGLNKSDTVMLDWNISTQ